MSTNPFIGSTSKPGHGTIDLALLPPCTPILKSLTFQYPLKLIAPSPVVIESPGQSRAITVYTVFFLTYGGGLVGGDQVHLNVALAPDTRLILLTQGSTKIFKSPTSQVVTFQKTVFDIGDNAAICYLADPAQPFESSVFEQQQIYHISEGVDANLCVCDWVSQGRRARGENWSFHSYTSRNEIWMQMHDGNKRLMLRDNIILDSNKISPDHIARQMDGLGIFGTLILRGRLFATLGQYFMEEFRQLPQIGAREWDTPAQLSTVEIQRAARVAAEKMDDLLWTAASIRGFVVVKFGAREVEGAKRWLRTMLKQEGTVEREFGERVLLCVK